jgi:HEAT repeats
MDTSQASLVALPLFFASLMLLAAANALASADNVSNALQASQPSSIQITLSKQANTAISLEARTAPLGQILKAIADKTGAQIHYSMLPPEPVTATCTGHTVSGLLECLLGSRVDRIYRYPRPGAVKLNVAKSSVARPNFDNPSTAKPLNALAQNTAIQPEEIWLLATNTPISPSMTKNALAQTQVPETPATPPEATAEEQAQIEDAIKMASSKNVDERSTGLYNLGLIGHKDDPNIRKALEEALADKDANVRTQAITALIQREGEDASLEVQQALKDKDVNVRMAVLSNVYDAELLQQALADSDQSVRNYAASKLDDMEAQQSRQKR